MQHVPTTKDVVPGALVEIVLKADQPTGRTVSGTVREVLTRGNHPRGIKVRLADGRIGRVQRLASAAGRGVDQEPYRAGAWEDSAMQDNPSGFPGWDSRRRRQGGRPLEEHDLPSHEIGIGLDAFLKPAKQRANGKGKAANNVVGTGPGEGSYTISDCDANGCLPTAGLEVLDTSTCPVCNSFEGDAEAVAHHVASHFDD
ncbi:hypothetical protein QBC46DRAFT_75867 [Diplogelasinospora grovesii]|uniref:Uncharacterized protein n=1 Tax=Diplogelasinospora grovesii TaxID=303347 RepID=A0AAN6RZH5_9PEZI|nr:hypothetical protein QBC46DRAFT_75867 [Diplogelasinospora grovesii]